MPENRRATAAPGRPDRSPTCRPERKTVTTPAELDWTELDQKAVDTSRVLAMDAVQKVGNGHPGTAMSLAPVAYLLFQKVMRHNPADPAWPGRDRFVLSCGHSSITLYTQLFLGGWGLELEDLKSLRTWGSKTPGHPEHGHTAGVETTTGPLGQGVANAVGMAMAARRERGLLDPNADEGASPFDHHIYAHLQRRRPRGGRQRRGLLARRHPAARQPHADLRRQPDLDRGRHRRGLHRGRRQALRGVRLARADRGLDPRRHRPTPRTCRSCTPRSARPRRSPTGPASSCCARSSPGRPRPPRAPAPRTAPPSAPRRSRPPRRSWASTPSCTSRSRRTSWRTPARWSPAARRQQAAWEQQFRALDDQAVGRPRAASSGSTTRTLPAGWTDALPTFDADPKGVATRKASGAVINALAGVIPELWGGSADLAESNNTTIKDAASFLPKGRKTNEWTGDPVTGRVLHFGIREHAMGAIMNGIALHGGTRVFGGTFLTFSDYMRGAVRLAALMQLPVTYVWTHDSIGLGEDGPTHQPIEHLAALRAIPGLDVVRPADANETAAVWRTVLEHADRPAGIALTRQNVPVFPRGTRRRRPGVGGRLGQAASGGYVLVDSPVDLEPGLPDVVLVGTGSEVQIAVAARELLAADGIRARVVSMPCREWFDAQDQAYRESVLPPTVKARVSVEAGVAMGWREIVGDHGKIVSIDHYGASADYARIYEEFGITGEAVANAARDSLRLVTD